MSIVDTMEPLRIDWNEESLIKEKEKVRKEEIYPLLRPVVGIRSRGYRFVPARDVIRVGSCEKETDKETQSEQDQGTTLNPEVSLVDGFINVQDDE